MKCIMCNADEERSPDFFRRILLNEYVQVGICNECAMKSIRVTCLSMYNNLYFKNVTNKIGGKE